MRLLVIFSFFLCSIILATGCTTKQHRMNLDEKSYELNKVQTARVGEPILWRQTGDQVRFEVWQGIFNGGWVKTDWSILDGSVREEILYTGNINKKLNLDYREYRVVERTMVPQPGFVGMFRPVSNFYAAPPFYQKLEYDLNESKTITFRNYKMQVENATNEEITFSVIQE
jgi:hypothetical protein